MIKVVLGNDDVDIDLTGLVGFLNEVSNDLQVEVVNLPEPIPDSEITRRTFQALAPQVPRDALFMILYTNKPYYNNFFYEESDDEKLIIASFSHWTEYTTLPKNNGAAFFLTEVLSETLDPTFRHTLNDESKPECIYDFLQLKAGIDSSMRSALVCSDCRARIDKKINRSKRHQKIYDDFRLILNHIGNASKWDDDILDYWSEQSGGGAKKKTFSVFISYAHEDEEWLLRVRQFLKPLERQALIDCWDDSRLQSGDKWKSEISKALVSADAAVLLVSPAFLASDFISDEELPKLLTRATAEGTRILCLLLSPSLYDTTDWEAYQTVNPPERTLVDLRPGEVDRFLDRLARDILDALNTK